MHVLTDSLITAAYSFSFPQGTDSNRQQWAPKSKKVFKTKQKCMSTVTNIYDKPIGKRVIIIPLFQLFMVLNLLEMLLFILLTCVNEDSQSSR